MTTRDEIMTMDEDALPEEKHAQYAIYLYDIILRKGVWRDWSMIHASAADRCRAWLLTMEVQNDKTSL